MKISRLMLATHQGVGLLIGIQVVLWITGGFVMSVLPIEKVRGEDWVAAPRVSEIAADVLLLDPATASSGLQLGALAGAELSVWLDRPVYRLHTSTGEHLVDAVAGTLLSPLTEAVAREVAERDYAGPGRFAAATLLTEGLLEIRGRELPLWRLDFDDSRHTTVYVSPTTGAVVGRRNTIWRVYDFFWMLHIMDYSERDNFNHPLLITAAVVAWLLATSGLWLVVLWLKRRSRRRRAAA